jgi:hypothetical protein
MRPVSNEASATVPPAREVGMLQCHNNPTLVGPRSGDSKQETATTKKEKASAAKKKSNKRRKTAQSIEDQRLSL